MFDNGLLQYYESLGSQKGILNASGLKFTPNLEIKKGKVRRGTINGKSYYLKSALRANKVDMAYYDAEILLSQIYNRAGIDSAVYLPVMFSDGHYLVSNDVESERSILASKYFYSCSKGSKILSIPFLADKKDLSVNPSKFYTKKAMQQQTKMRILDTATCNYDRHRDNFFYKVRQPIVDAKKDDGEVTEGSSIVDFFRGIIPNKATDVVAIDFGVSGNIAPLLHFGEEYISIYDHYSNDFSRKLMYRDELINEIAENENLSQLIDKKDFAETIGSINPYSVAQDIQDTTGYAVNQDYTSFLSKALDDMAETLIL